MDGIATSDQKSARLIWGFTDAMADDLGDIIAAYVNHQI
jgi:hypothetical protein